MKPIFRPDFRTAREILLRNSAAVTAESVELSRCLNRVLAEDVRARYDSPPFDRSPYDGYAFRAEDSADAAKDAGVALRIIGEVRAGETPSVECTRGTAVKVQTGAQMPEGADAVVKYEDTSFTEDEVVIFRPAGHGENVIYAGEDISKGTLIAGAGRKIDAGTLGALAAQGIFAPKVYRVPRVGVISTGSELTENGGEMRQGRIYDSNRYMLSAELARLGCEPVFIGHAQDDSGEIAALFDKALAECDAVISSGGVSAGEYDLVPAALESIGAAILIRGAKLKPGMACIYGTVSGKPVMGLSGNPASAFTNFHAIAAPALRRLAGLAEAIPGDILLTLSDVFPKFSQTTRLLRGRLDLSDGTARLSFSVGQGNTVLTSAIGCDAMAIIPAGSGPVAAGTVLHGFLL